HLREEFDPAWAIISPPAPSSYMAQDNGSRLVIARGDRVTALSWADLFASVRDSGAANEPTLRSIEAREDELFVTVQEQGGPIVGGLVVSTHPPFSTQFFPLNLTGDVDTTGELATIEEHGRRRFFLAGKTDLFSDLSVWELDAVRSPTVRATYAPL